MFVTKKVWYCKSFNKQMAEIGAAIKRTIWLWRTELMKETKNIIPCEYEEAKVAKELFEFTKDDPKNVGVVREIERAEEEINYFWSMGEYFEAEEWNQRAKEILEYWTKYKEASCKEIANYSKKFFLLVRGHRGWNDTYEWLGIYDDVEKVKRVYETAFGKLIEEREKYDGLLDDDTVMVFVFDTEDEENGEMFYREIQLN